MRTSPPSTRLDEILNAEGRKSRWLAQALDVHESAVWRWRKGIHLPEEATREAIAEVLGRHVDDVFPPEIVPAVRAVA